MVILQSHRTQNMILRCYPTVSAIYFGDTPNLVSCAFSTIPIFHLFNSQNFKFTCNNNYTYEIIVFAIASFQVVPIATNTSTDDCFFFFLYFTVQELKCVSVLGELHNL